MKQPVNQKDILINHQMELNVIVILENAQKKKYLIIYAMIHVLLIHKKKKMIKLVNAPTHII